MRRIALLLLMIALFTALMGCVNAAPPSPVSPPVPTVTAVVSSAGAQQVLLPRGALPEASYEAASQPTRFYMETTNKLIASDEYGHIWPYIGAYYNTRYIRSEYYGFCDDKGRIICDPIFNSVEIIERDGTKLYKATVYHRDGNNRVSKITLAKPDGTWAQEYDDVRTDIEPYEYIGSPYDENFMLLRWRSSISTEYITVRKGDKWGAIDYNGKEILPCAYRNPLLFSEGLASVLSDDGKSVLFIDKTGKTVLGPYQAQPGLENNYEDPYGLSISGYDLIFHEDRTRFYEDGKFGVIDKSGKIIVAAKYDYITSYSGATAEFVDDGKFGVLGLNGELLLEATSNSIEKGKNSIILSENNQFVSLNVFTGERKPWSYQDEVNVWSAGIRDGVKIKLANGGAELSFPDAYSVDELDNGNFVLTKDPNNPKWLIIDPSGATIAGPFEGRCLWDESGIIYIGIVENTNSWDYYLTVVYDYNGKRLLPDAYLSVKPFDGRFLVRDDTDAGLLDENGRWVIKVPLYEFMGD